MTIDLTDNAPRISYTVNQGVTQTSFTVPFEFFDTTDLKVPKRFKTLNKKNFEEMYKLGAATIHKRNLLNNEDFITFKIRTKRMDDILINNNIGCRGTRGKCFKWSH